jgi:hypothetical protein
MDPTPGWRRLEAFASVGKLVGFVVFAALVAGAGFAAYNQFQYELLQPYPVSWNHGPREHELLQLSRERRGLVARIASAQRIGSIGGLRLPLETTAEHQEALKAELAALDARIAALRAAIGAQPER